MNSTASLPTPLRALSSVGSLPLSRELRAAHRRRHLLRAATELFGNRGYRGVTTENLTTACEIATGSFYLMFADKKGCLLQAHEDVVATARKAIVEAVPAGAPRPVQVEVALRALVEHCLADPTAARLALIVIRSAGREGAARYDDSLREAESFLRDGRALSAAAEALPPDYERFAVGAASWLLARSVEPGAEPEADELLAELRELLLPYLGAETAEPEAAAPLVAGPV